VQNRTIVKAGRRLAGGSDYRALTPEKGKGRRERSLKDSLEACVGLKHAKVDAHYSSQVTMPSRWLQTFRF
jgi:hypothetical protein